MKKSILILSIALLIIPIAVWAQCGDCPNQGEHSSKSNNKTEDNSRMSGNAKVSNLTLSGYNKSVALADGKYFKYSFDKKPKMGVSILKVSVFDKKNRLSDDFDVYVVADMPSMKGAHSSGDVKMKPNKKGELLLPINFVMPGVWEVELKFFKAGKQLHYGSFQLKI